MLELVKLLPTILAALLTACSGCTLQITVSPISQGPGSQTTAELPAAEPNQP
jgi:hypothetical protein